jgi:hypothetical protein
MKSSSPFTMKSRLVLAFSLLLLALGDYFGGAQKFISQDLSESQKTIG